MLMWKAAQAGGYAEAWQSGSVETGDEGWQNRLARKLPSTKETQQDRQTDTLQAARANRGESGCRQSEGGLIANNQTPALELGVHIQDSFGF